MARRISAQLRWRVVIGALIALSGLSWVVFAQTWFLHDLPLFHFIGWRISEGDTPYRDIWDMNGPLVYLAHLIMVEIPGPPGLVLSGFTAGLTGVCLLSAAQAAGDKGGAPLIGLGTSLILLLWLTYRADGLMAQRDMMLAACAAGGLAAALCAGSGRFGWALSGFFIGLSVGVKPIAAPMALLVVGAAIAMDVLARSQWRRTASVVAGGAAGGLVWIVFLLVTGSFLDWRQMTFEFTPAVYATLLRVPAGQLMGDGAVLVALAASVACLAAAGLSWMRGEAAARCDAVRLILTAGFTLTGVFMFVFQAKGWVYHSASAGVLGVIACGVAARWFSARGWALLAIGMIIISALDIRSATSLRSQFSEQHRIEQVQRQAFIDQMAEALRALPEGMPIQPLDNTDGAVHAIYEAKRALASPVMYDFWLFTGPANLQARARKAMIDGLNADHGAILLMNLGWPGVEGTGFARFEGDPELSAFFKRGYALKAEGEEKWVSGEAPPTEPPRAFRLYVPVARDGK